MSKVRPERSGQKARELALDQDYSDLIEFIKYGVCVSEPGVFPMTFYLRFAIRKKKRVISLKEYYEAWDYIIKSNDHNGL